MILILKIILLEIMPVSATRLDDVVEEDCTGTRTLSISGIIAFLCVPTPRIRGILPETRFHENAVHRPLQSGTKRTHGHTSSHNCNFFV